MKNEFRNTSILHTSSKKCNRFQIFANVAIEQTIVNRNTLASCESSMIMRESRWIDNDFTWETIPPHGHWRAPDALAHACGGTGLHGVATLTGAHLNPRRVFVGQFALKERVRQRRGEILSTRSRSRHKIHRLRFDATRDPYHFDDRAVTYVVYFSFSLDFDHSNLSRAIHNVARECERKRVKRRTAGVSRENGANNRQWDIARENVSVDCADRVPDDLTLSTRSHITSGFVPSDISSSRLIVKRRSRVVVERRLQSRTIESISVHAAILRRRSGHGSRLRKLEG